MNTEHKQPGRRNVFLSAPAQSALGSRVVDASTSHVLNSIVIRYNAIINELYPTIERKFEAVEQQALIHLYSSYTTRSKRTLWRFDNRSHQQVFCGIFRTSMSRGRIHGLNESQSRKLLDILERHTSTIEFLALCDWLSLQGVNREVLGDA